MNTNDEITRRFWNELFNLADNMRDTSSAMLVTKSEWNLTIQQMRLLRVVYRKTNRGTSSSGVMLKTIAKNLNVTSAAVCGMVEAMVKKGLLNRSRSETNRRSVNITLSKYSIEKIAEMEKSLCGLASEIESEIGEEQFAALTASLEKISRNFTERHPDTLLSKL